MTRNTEGQQMVMLPEGSNRVMGKNAQKINIYVAYAVAEAVKTTLGPKGMDKMLVSELGDIVITNDGATILEEMNVDHPAAKIMVEIAKTQDKEVGDGTTTSVVLAGHLLKNAGDLLDKGIHPSTIIKGFHLSANKASKLLDEKSQKVTMENKEKLKEIAGISMGSKSVGLGDAKDMLAELVTEAVITITEKNDGHYVIDNDLIKIEKKAGGSVQDTKLIKGVLIDKEMVHTGMSKKLKDVKIALINSALEINKTETDAKIQITSPDQMQQFLQQEENSMKEMVDKIVSAGATMVFCQKGIDDVVQHFLAKNNVSAVRRVKKSDMDKLARATGARVATSLSDLSGNDLGKCGVIEERKISGESMIFVEECEHAKSVTIFVRASTEHVVNEGERAIVDAIGAVSSAIEDGSYVTGGGSIEIELAQGLREYATQIGGREQLAIQAFAESLEIIPKTLAESCGMDAIDAIVTLRTKSKGDDKHYGINVYNAEIDDMELSKVIEPTRVKKQAISSATEAATMLLRIDDMISSKGKAGGPDMGGMPPMM